MEKIYNCLILNDYPQKHYATWMAEMRKTIETRTREFKYRGDLIICCGEKSVTKNAGLALCVVNYYDCLPMTEKHEKAAMIQIFPKAKAMLLKDWRYFNRKFSFSKRWVSGAFQGIFQITLPEDVYILPTKEQNERMAEFYNHGFY